MAEQIKLYLGLGPVGSYPEPTIAWRAIFGAVQITLVVLLVLADSWFLRAALIVVTALALAAIATVATYDTNDDQPEQNGIL